MNVLDVMERAMGQIDKALNHAGNVDPACELRQARAAVAELIEAADRLQRIYHLMDADPDFIRLRAALARIGGAA